ncbi:hypothetical protein I305_03389 [Cryptococcus gattii E566]|uniref:Uncharacterized protein n=1 Tax=Cryptococcus gattii serotype B (strain WM276 / ATCC MYA-4071) TaxID=367775 RepID=E6R5M2_CRYGW|nr:Hypothetical protein CGB_D1790W [Cryptococcus gattii WM276]ADV21551.1 Hypothetical protein CGB_D1790W [Cryptococcus gattii WM276]KIY34043.1 hypothetical protein I305_03389 [Cryptococcus gattii E566]
MSCEDFLFTDKISPQSSIELEEADLVNTITTVDSVLKSLTPLSTNVIKGYILTWAGKGNFARGEIPFWAYHKVVVVLPYGQYPITQRTQVCLPHSHSTSIDGYCTGCTLAIAVRNTTEFRSRSRLPNFTWQSRPRSSFKKTHLLDSFMPPSAERSKIARKIDCEVGGSRTCWADWKPAGTWSALCRDFW